LSFLKSTTFGAKYILHAMLFGLTKMAQDLRLRKLGSFSVDQPPLELKDNTENLSKKLTSQEHPGPLQKTYFGILDK